MKHFNYSDYAVNKFSPHLVYRFATGCAQVTKRDFLAQHPSKTTSDYQHLKSASDALYLDQVRRDNNQTRKNLSLSALSEQVLICEGAEELYDRQLQHRKIQQATQALLRKNHLTPTQKRRFVRHYLYGRSIRQIARAEQVCPRAVWDSLQGAIKKLKKLYD